MTAALLTLLLSQSIDSTSPRQPPRTIAIDERLAADAGLKVGDRVAYAGPTGGYSEVRLIEADRLVRLPDAISFDQSAAMMLQGMTAQVLVRQVYPVKAGDLILVHAAAGGTGGACAASMTRRP